MASLASMDLGTWNGEALLEQSEAREKQKPVPRYFAWSGWIQRALGLTLLVLFLPVIAILVVLVRLTSRGPGLYNQIRVGKGGRAFVLYKIRTMRVDAEAKTGPVWTTSKDPRVNTLGLILRATHLDELPQLFNVVRGDMSLVGPRPERPEFTQYLAKEIPDYVDRLRVKPGVTGLAQINLPPDTDLNSVRDKLVLDLQYVERGGFWFDIRIILCTAFRLIGIRGLQMAKLFGLRCKVPHESPEQNGVSATASLAAIRSNGHSKAPLSNLFSANGNDRGASSLGQNAESDDQETQAPKSAAHGNRKDRAFTA